MKNLCLLTCEALPDLHPDDVALSAALTRLGVRVTSQVWTRETGAAFGADACLIRSTWDYHEKPAAYLAFMTELAGRTRLWNDLAVVRWNIDKRYLKDLAAAQVPVIETEWVSRGEKVAMAPLLERLGEVVVKPRISAGARRTQRFTPEQVGAAQAHLDALVATDDVMVQPYYPSVVSVRERSLLYFGGELSHAVLRQPALEVGVDIASTQPSWEPTREERKLAEKALATSPVPPLYARVDIVYDRADQPRVIELELLEPRLFLANSPGSTERLADVLHRALG